MSADLARVKRATKRRADADREWREAIRQAVRDGASLRAVADAAGVTHPRVLQISRELDERFFGEGSEQACDGPFVPC